VSRADKIAARGQARLAFLASRPLRCCQCGVRFIDVQLAQAMRESGVPDVLCDDCSWELGPKKVGP
jgi:hypothetical protein